MSDVDQKDEMSPLSYLKIFFRRKELLIIPSCGIDNVMPSGTVGLNVINWYVSFVVKFMHCDWMQFPQTSHMFNL